MHIKVVENLPILDPLLGVKSVLVLARYRDKTTRRRSRYNRVHHNLIRCLVFNGYLHGPSRVHEQRRNKYHKRARKQHTDVRCEEGTIAILLVHLEDQQDLLVGKLAELGEHLTEASNFLTEGLLLLMAVVEDDVVVLLLENL